MKQRRLREFGAVASEPEAVPSSKEIYVPFQIKRAQVIGDDIHLQRLVAAQSIGHVLKCRPGKGRHGSDERPRKPVGWDS